MTDLITLTGLVATTPRHITTSEGLAITSFRLASSQRRYDRVQQSWIDGDTNWYTVSAFRNLAQNAATSVSKGDRVILTGRVRIRDWENTDRSGTTVEVEAESVGHDLTWGTAVYTRTTTTLSTDDSQWVPVDEPETQHESENSSAA
jgi:single-strand DNA-binding protein